MNDDRLIAALAALRDDPALAFAEMRVRTRLECGSRPRRGMPWILSLTALASAGALALALWSVPPPKVSEPRDADALTLEVYDAILHGDASELDLLVLLDEGEVVEELPAPSQSLAYEATSL